MSKIINSSGGDNINMDPILLAIIAVVVVVVVVLGPKKIPEIARTLGLAKKEFDEGKKDSS
jgi:TatA/E family protein of Tat protein translocase